MHFKSAIQKDAKEICEEFKSYYTNTTDLIPR